MKPIERPETPAQAQRWETVKNRYLHAGLCLRCASQAAWGHQCGFTRVHPACDLCAGTDLPRSLTDRHGYEGVKWLRRSPNDARQGEYGSVGDPPGADADQIRAIAESA